MNNNSQHNSSFRDPSGFVYLDKGVVKRQINPLYFEQYNKLKSSGVFNTLFENKLLIEHKELEVSKEKIIIQPEYIPFITYPYEWSFNQFKEAALLTLKIQKYAMSKGMSLKDASAFNVTYYKGNAIFIDTLSFDFYQENQPWRAYKQFIMHFLGPLVLAHYHGSAMLKQMSSFIDGIPLQMLASMLPFKSKFSPLLYTNIHMLAKYEGKHNEDYSGKAVTKSLSKKGLLNIIDTLYGYIKSLELKETSEWSDYYNKINYSTDAFKSKSTIINNWLSNLKVNKLIDIGGNDGTFVRKLNIEVEQALVCDIDNGAVDFNYSQVKKNKENYITPFVLDVLSPSASLGFNNEERFSFLKRISDFAPDVTFALAVIHHITLSGNVSFDMSAKFFASFSKYLIIEFPKREDSWVQRLLKTKGEFESHFNFYNEENFISAYTNYFEIIEEKVVVGAERKMYLLRNLR